MGLRGFGNRSNVENSKETRWDLHNIDIKTNEKSVGQKDILSFICHAQEDIKRLSKGTVKNKRCH